MASRARSITPVHGQSLERRISPLLRLVRSFRPCREHSPGTIAPCDYDIRHNLNARYVYRLPIRVNSHRLGFALNGRQVSGTIFWDSGIPFSVLSTPLFRQWQRHRAGRGDRSLRISCPASHSISTGLFPRVTQPGTIQRPNPDPFVPLLIRKRRLHRGRQSEGLPAWEFRAECAPRA
jgi:hypothetical protein